MSDHPSAPDDLRAEAIRRVIGEHRPIKDSRGETKSCGCGVLFGIQHQENGYHGSHLARQIAAALPVLAADREAEVETVTAYWQDIVRCERGAGHRAVTEARAEIERWHSAALSATAGEARAEHDLNEAREQLAVERGKVAAVESFVVSLEQADADCGSCSQRLSHTARLRRIIDTRTCGCRGIAKQVCDTCQGPALADPGQWEAGS